MKNCQDIIHELYLKILQFKKVTKSHPFIHRSEIFQAVIRLQQKNSQKMKSNQCIQNYEKFESLQKLKKFSLLTY